MALLKNAECVKILNYSLEEINAFIEQKRMRKKAIVHYEVCKNIKDHITQSKISEKFDISPRQVRKIKRCNCPEYGISVGHRK